ncbi:polyhydroxyalkanoate depolymerase [Paroceanicella profunda]|uniref:Polyhydroxyalkanoate depolymerase n=1 Tax=Paroceanicella profunda TaxID=2579971 RepID=A0A5B8FWI0_9RHOB|nr:polyhydroxyalkanoate depolymerase [Paroceanicella profunda]QDL91874.1 polyhydroxyalkanoate depolymerase [Paroceanicella profunda]
MLYQLYQAQDDMLTPVRDAADWMRSLLDMFSGARGTEAGPGLPERSLRAGLEMISRLELSHVSPAFGITSVPSGNRDAQVHEEVALDLPFGRLLHFVKDSDVPQPKVLVVAPLSGHFATLLRGTVETLLRDHDVYITDWTNARDVPLSAGRFGVEDYITYIIRFLEQMGPRSHILAVCQPCVQALAAVAVMSEDKHPATPLSMTLMAGPIDVRESPTTVNQLANEHPIEWFEDKLIATVPWRYKGGGRRVYPGFVQLGAFMTMNMDRHKKTHRELYDHLVAGDEASAERIKTFYDEYFAVLDLTEEFYIETIDMVFQRALLAKGELTYKGRPVRPGAIMRTALLTVEGGRDDICAIGQTAAAHELCTGLRPHLKRHHLQANVGHYGVFNGRKWQNEIYPLVRNLMLAME